MGGSSYRIEPDARVQILAHVVWLEERNVAASTRFSGAIEYAIKLLAVGDVDGTPVVLPSGRQVRRWHVPPLTLYYERFGNEVVVLEARHDARRPLTE